MQHRRTLVLPAVLVVLCAAGALVAEALPAPALPLADGWLAPGTLLERLSDRLELTDEQQGEIRATIRAHGPELAAGLEAVKTARLDLFEAIHRHPVSEADVRAAAARLAAVQADLAVARSRVVDDVHDRLTIEQQDELARLEQDAASLIETVATVVVAAIRARLGA